MTGVGYGICTFVPGEKDDNRCFLKAYLDGIRERLEMTRKKADPYVDLAYRSLESYILKKKVLDIPDGLPEEMLRARAGAFVSIHKHGRLRGCIGTIGPTMENVALEIINNAISASTRDPRFAPIDASELEWLDINVDVLGEPELIHSIDELDVKKYGVIVTSGRKRGLLLPDLDGVDTVEEQVAIAMQKGGIYEDEDFQLHRFEVIRHT